MIIECEFTNASDFVREWVVFVTGMQLKLKIALCARCPAFEPVTIGLGAV